MLIVCRTSSNSDCHGINFTVSRLSQYRLYKFRYTRSMSCSPWIKTKQTKNGLMGFSIGWLSGFEHLCFTCYCFIRPDSDYSQQNPFFSYTNKLWHCILGCITLPNHLLFERDNSSLCRKYNLRFFLNIIISENLITALQNEFPESRSVWRIRTIQ